MDVETTGLKVGHHEITQICCLPLDGNLKPRQDILPFDLMLHIDFEERIDWEALRVTKTNFFKHQQASIDKWEAAELFESWVERLNLREGKRICPLAHNWPFDKGFVSHWLGHEMFELLIDGRFRDTMALALAINDEYDHKNEPVMFPKVNLGYIASQLKIQHQGAHSALGDCITTAEVYKTLISRDF
jgi:DNA polymerase III epsilon subunit-like protein